MTGRWSVGVIGLLATALAAGCFKDGPTSLPAPTPGPPTISFQTADQSTGVSAVSIWVSDSGSDVPLELLRGIAMRVRVSTWPGGADVPSTATITTTAGEQLPNGAERLAYGQIEQQVDGAVEGNGWYAVSLPERAGDYRLNEAVLFSFGGGAFGVRISPAHPPVVASVMSCAKEGGVVAVYAQFSEPVNNAPGALALDYGATPMTCAVGAESTGEDQFVCANATAGQPFSLHIVGAVTAQSSSLAMAPGTLRSADMQVSTTNDGCWLYKPAIAGASSASR